MSSGQAKAVVTGVREAVDESRYQLFALAILPDHVHAVVAEHTNTPHRVIAHFKTRATQALLALGLHPFSQQLTPTGRLPSVWAYKGWAVYLDTPGQVRGRIAYVEENPVEIGMKRQRYTFVVPFTEG